MELNSGNRPIVRIPTVENMLEDGLLMIGLFVVKDPGVIETANAVRKEFSGRVQDYNEIDKANRAKLFESTRKIGPQTKLAITVLEGSSVSSQLHVLERYQLSIEVCQSARV